MDASAKLHSNRDGDYVVFYYSKSYPSLKNAIILKDWWLVKAGEEEKELAVAGFDEDSTELFCSAPITKRYTACSLETSDDVIVLLQGIFLKYRTIENGFSPEVYNHFLSGFPPDWEEKLIGKEGSDFAGFQEETFDVNSPSGNKYELPKW